MLMNEIDESEGVDNPPRVKRARRVFPRPTYNTSSACAEVQWCGELVLARSQAIAVFDYSVKTLLKKGC